MWFEYRQNNSGGHIVFNEHVAEIVYIEASSPKAANLAAEDLGLYFDGCQDGRDCSCCGDRWYEAWDGVEDIPLPQTLVFIEQKSALITGQWTWTDTMPANWGDAYRPGEYGGPAVAHYLNGTRKYGIPTFPPI